VRPLKRLAHWPALRADAADRLAALQVRAKQGVRT
jgi:hypothetical protein